MSAASTPGAPDGDRTRPAPAQGPEGSVPGTTASGDSDAVGLPAGPEGRPSPSHLRRALDAVTAAAPHLRWRIGESEAPPGQDTLSCARLAAEPDTLAVAVAATAEGRGSDDAQVLASLWWQAYAYRVAGTALACWLLTGTAPDVRAQAMAVGIARSRPSSVVYRAGDQRHGVRQSRVPALGHLVDDLFAGHLDLVAASLRARHPLGAQLVWGNVAAACASGVGAVHHAAGPDWPDRLAAFLAAAPHGLARLGRWSYPDSGPAFRRRTCCLWWKTTVADGALCADCSLHRPPATDPPAAAPTPGSPPPA